MKIKIFNEVDRKANDEKTMKLIETAAQGKTERSEIYYGRRQKKGERRASAR